MSKTDRFGLLGSSGCSSSTKHPRQTIRSPASRSVALEDVFNILLPSYITTIYRATTLTGEAHSHKKKRIHAWIGALPLRCYVKTHRIDLPDGAVRPSGLCYRSNASPVAIHSAQTRCPSSVAHAGKPSVRSSSRFAHAATSHLSRQWPRPIHRTINANSVRNGHRIFTEPGPSSPTFRHCGKPSARSSIEANIHWHSHSLGL
jgi:hypothetical protein